MGLGGGVELVLPEKMNSCCDPCPRQWPRRNVNKRPLCHTLLLQVTKKTASDNKKNSIQICHLLLTAATILHQLWKLFNAPTLWLTGQSPTERNEGSYTHTQTKCSSQSRVINNIHYLRKMRSTTSTPCRFRPRLYDLSSPHPDSMERYQVL